MNYSIIKAGANDRLGILFILEQFNMHHIPSLEMDELDIDKFFVAKIRDKIVGAAGYKMLSPTEAKTTLMGVLPEFSGDGIGKELHHERMKAVYALGAKTLTTNADRHETIIWYKKHFGYKEIGKLKKLCAFGGENIDYWTTLRTDLEKYFAGYEEQSKRRLDYIAENDKHPLSPYPPLIINVCLTGMVPTANQTPFVPISPDDIIKDAVEVYDAGASIVHLHARDDNGKPTPDAAYYEKIIKGIRRERPDMICCATTSGRNWSDFEHRSAVLYLEGDAKPDMASLTTGSLNFITGPSKNSINMIERLAMAMKEQGIKPELEVFDLGMINIVKYLERNRIINGTKYINMLLGNINTAQADIGSLAAMINALPADSVWGATGIGRFQLPVNTAAIAAGGHVRVGIEDSIYYDYEKTQLASNRQLTERIVRIANELQRPIATPAQARVMIGLDE